MQSVVAPNCRMLWTFVGQAARTAVRREGGSSFSRWPVTPPPAPAQARPSAAPDGCARGPAQVLPTRGAFATFSFLF